MEQDVGRLEVVVDDVAQPVQQRHLGQRAGPVFMVLQHFHSLAVRHAFCPPDLALRGLSGHSASYWASTEASSCCKQVANRTTMGAPARGTSLRRPWGTSLLRRWGTSFLKCCRGTSLLGRAGCTSAPLTRWGWQGCTKLDPSSKQHLAQSSLKLTITPRLPQPPPKHPATRLALKDY